MGRLGTGGWGRWMGMGMGMGMGLGFGGLGLVVQRKGDRFEGQLGRPLLLVMMTDLKVRWGGCYCW